MIEQVLSLESHFHLLVVDDNSPDGTAEIVKLAIPESNNRLFLLKRQEKNGLGKAYIAGFKWALERDFDFIFEMDADFSHNPADLPKLLKPCVDDICDVAIGSRYKTGVNVVNWPMSRVLLSYFASVYVRFITRMNIMDATAGFKCFKREVLESIDLDKIKFKGYAFQIELKYTAWKAGFRLHEVPIIFTEREFGQSKITKNIVWEAVGGVIRIRLESFFRKNYRK